MNTFELLKGKYGDKVKYNPKNQQYYIETRSPLASFLIFLLKWWGLWFLFAFLLAMIYSASLNENESEGWESFVSCISSIVSLPIAYAWEYGASKHSRRHYLTQQEIQNIEQNTSQNQTAQKQPETKKPTPSTLEEKLQEIEGLRYKKLIDEEEYKQLKKKALDAY